MEILRVAGVCDDYASLSEAARVKLLAREIANPRPLTWPDSGAPGTETHRYGDETREAIAVFQTAKELQDELGPAACNVYIISMTAGVSDILAPLLLAKEAGLFIPARGNAGPANIFEEAPQPETARDHRPGVAGADYRGYFALREKLPAAANGVVGLLPQGNIKNLSYLLPVFRLQPSILVHEVDTVERSLNGALLRLRLNRQTRSH